MRMDDGSRRSVGTPWGTVVSIFTACVLIAYFIQKVHVLTHKTDVSTDSSDINDSFGPDYKLKNDGFGLNFAVGLVDYFDEEMVFDDDSYGQIRIF